MFGKNTYRGTHLLWASILVVFVLSIMSHGVLAGGPLLTARLLNQQPPAAPAGSSVQIHIIIENVGDERADVYAYKLLLPRGVIQLTPREEWVNASSLDATQRSSTGLILSYTLRLPPDVPSGTLPIQLIAKKKGGSISTLAEIPLTIRNPSSISVVNVTINPTPIRPGEAGNMTITLANTGADTYQNIPLTLMSTYVTYPQGNVRIISLPPYETRSVTIPIRILPTAQPGYASYTVTVGNLTWEGMLTIQGTPQYVITVEAVKDDANGRSVTLGVANTGSMSLRSVVISTPNATPTAVAIGRLDEDDYDTATVLLPPDTLEITGHILYRDAYGAQHDDSFTLPLPPVAQQVTSPWRTFLLILGIGILVILFLRRGRRDRLKPITA